MGGIGKCRQWDRASYRAASTGQKQCIEWIYYKLSSDFEPLVKLLAVCRYRDHGFMLLGFRLFLQSLVQIKSGCCT